MSNPDAIRASLKQLQRQAQAAKSKRDIALQTLEHKQQQHATDLKFYNGEIDKLSPFAEQKQSEIDSYTQTVTMKTANFEREASTIQRTIDQTTSQLSKLKQEISELESEYERAQKVSHVKSAIWHLSID